MTEIAVKYLERMEITDTQFVIVRHNDREHPHCHIILIEFPIVVRLFQIQEIITGI